MSSSITAHVFKALRLISMQTDDPLNAYRTVQHYMNLPLSNITILKKTGIASLVSPKANNQELWKAMKSFDVVIIDDAELLSKAQLGIDWSEILEGCREYQTTIVIVNPLKEIPLAFNVGYLEVPREVVREYLEKFIIPESMDEMMSACAGLSIRQVTDIGKIATSMYIEFSPHTAELVRAKYFISVEGLSRLNLHDEFYAPSEELTAWIEMNKATFSEDVHRLLRPRGILADGTAGTGKTSGARHIAREFGVPCYLLRTEEIFSKYVGDSGRNLSRVLAQAESFSPCVLVMDEVEKLFSTQTGETHGTTTKLLAQLLWWLQEHNKMIITVMTTNNLSIIPPELYRAGRLDGKMTFGAMSHWEDIKTFSDSYKGYFCKTTGSKLGTKEWQILQLGLEAEFTQRGNQLSHSEVIQYIVNWVKRRMQDDLKAGGLQTKPSGV